VLYSVDYCDKYITLDQCLTSLKHLRMQHNFCSTQIDGCTKLVNWTNLSCSVIDDFLCCQVALVSNEKLVYIFAGITIYFLQPLLYIVERLLCQPAINYNTAVPKCIQCKLWKLLQQSFYKSHTFPDAQTTVLK